MKKHISIKNSFYKKKSITYLKKLLWTKYFTPFIKARDKGICFTCGQVQSGKGLHCGHYIPKKIGGNLLYFNELNVHCQCFHCNINLGGYGAMYHINMIKK